MIGKILYLLHIDYFYGKGLFQLSKTLVLKNKYQNEDLKRKVIESLLVKGYNYKSVKALVEGMKEND